MFLEPSSDLSGAGGQTEMHHSQPLAAMTLHRWYEQDSAPWKVSQQSKLTLAIPSLSQREKVMACDTRGHLHGQSRPDWNSLAIRNLKLLPRTSKEEERFCYLDVSKL